MGTGLPARLSTWSQVTSVVLISDLCHRKIDSTPMRWQTWRQPLSVAIWSSEMGRPALCNAWAFGVGGAAARRNEGRFRSRCGLHTKTAPNAKNPTDIDRWGFSYN